MLSKYEEKKMREQEKLFLECPLEHDGVINIILLTYPFMNLESSETQFP